MQYRLGMNVRSCRESLVAVGWLKVFGGTASAACGVRWGLKLALMAASRFQAGSRRHAGRLAWLAGTLASVRP
jgi:hypothetical protein